MDILYNCYVKDFKQQDNFSNYLIWITNTGVTSTYTHTTRIIHIR